MKLEIDGELLEVQGSIERALEIIESKKWDCKRNETSATKEYLFSNMELGEIGKLKISILPKKKTELYSYSVDYPDVRWLIKYFPDNFPFHSISLPLQQLLSVYSWQVENNLFDLTPTELYQLGMSDKHVDWGWERNGLGDIELRKQAEKEFKGWRHKIFDLRKKDLNQILDVVVTQIGLDGLSAVEFDGKVKTIFPKSQSMLAEEEQAKNWKVEKVRQKGRYRLSKDEIKFRRGKVKEANAEKKKNPLKRWGEIDAEFADQLGISPGSFRHWRHNNY